MCVCVSSPALQGIPAVCPLASGLRILGLVVQPGWKTLPDWGQPNLCWWGKGPVEPGFAVDNLSGGPDLIQASNREGNFCAFSHLLFVTWSFPGGKIALLVFKTLERLPHFPETPPPVCLPPSPCPSLAWRFIFCLEWLTGLHSPREQKDCEPGPLRDHQGPTP